MNEHDFIDDRLWTIYQSSCHRDFNSPRCRYFQYELEMDEDQVNPHSIIYFIIDVYEVCKQAKSAQTARMMEVVRSLRKNNARKNKENLL